MAIAFVSHGSVPTVLPIGIVHGMEPANSWGLNTCLCLQMCWDIVRLQPATWLGLLEACFHSN